MVMIIQNRPTKIFKYTLLLLIFTLTILGILFGGEMIGGRNVYSFSRFKFYKNNGTCPGCQTIFTDDVSNHRKAYYQDGIKPQHNSNKFVKLKNKGVLKYIVSNKYFTVRELDYSYPYLLPKAHDFIYEICKTYEDSCLQNNLEYIPITITSLIRTKESVQRLKRKNKNAIKESPHMKGKTFDISHKDFENNSKQFELFRDILIQYKKKKFCFVKYESNGCLHITVN